jgi:hypothetical protein
MGYPRRLAFRGHSGRGVALPRKDGIFKRVRPTLNARGIATPPPASGATRVIQRYLGRWSRRLRRASLWSSVIACRPRGGVRLADHQDAFYGRREIGKHKFQWDWVNVKKRLPQIQIMYLRVNNPIRTLIQEICDFS